MRVVDRAGKPAPDLIVAALCSGDVASDPTWADLRTRYRVVPDEPWYDRLAERVNRFGTGPFLQGVTTVAVALGIAILAVMVARLAGADL